MAISPGSHGNTARLPRSLRSLATTQVLSMFLSRSEAVLSLPKEAISSTVLHYGTRDCFAPHNDDRNVILG